MALTSEKISLQEEILPGVKLSFITTAALPLVIEPENTEITLQEFLEFLKLSQKTIQKKLLSFGGILFRNFPLKNEYDFAAVIKALGCGERVQYIGGDSPRKNVIDGIYTSTEAPPSFKIPLHNELSFVKHYPSHIFFFCQTPSETKGQTILADARKVYADVDPKIKKAFISKGLTYISRYYDESLLMDLLNYYQPSHKSWRQVFETSDKEEVELLCKKNDFGFKWNKNNWLEITQKRPATILHPLTQEAVWFNQAHLYDFNPRLLGLSRYLCSKLFYIQKYTKLHEVTFSDGTPIPRSYFYHILEALDANTLYFSWQAGDLLALDNVLAMHGRAPFTGKRRILTAMTSQKND
jgi:alpha-ketoglutarate-dependent taurine dioxygenase